MSSNKDRWIDAGYFQFGQVGPEALNVERLSILVGLNRSSFYHYFGDVGLYEEALLAYHVGRFEKMKRETEHCQNFDPDLLQTIPNYVKEIAFQRQLLINQAVPRYRQCFDEARSHTEPNTFKLWTAHSAKSKNQEEYSLFTAVRDYYLVHFEQGNDDQVKKVIEDIRVLFHGHAV